LGVLRFYNMAILCSLLVGLHQLWSLESLLVVAEADGLAVVQLRACHGNDRHKMLSLMMM
jgi:hypothetical protein